LAVDRCCAVWSGFLTGLLTVAAVTRFSVLLGRPKTLEAGAWELFRDAEEWVSFLLKEDMRFQGFCCSILR